MDAGRGAVAGDAGSDDGDEGDGCGAGGSGAQLRLRRLQIRFITRTGRRRRDGDRELEGIYDGERTERAERDTSATIAGGGL